MTFILKSPYGRFKAPDSNTYYNDHPIIDGKIEGTQFTVPEHWVACIPDFPSIKEEQK